MDKLLAAQSIADKINARLAGSSQLYSAVPPPSYSAVPPPSYSAVPPPASSPAVTSSSASIKSVDGKVNLPEALAAAAEKARRISEMLNKELEDTRLKEQSQGQMNPWLFTPSQVSQRELEGMKFGLHRPGFTSQSSGMKSIKLLIGLEVIVTDPLGFPLLESLTGPNMSYLTHIMREAPGVVILLQGQGSKIGGDEPLHFKIMAKDDSPIQKAKQLAESLVMTVQNQFQQFKIQAAQLMYSYPPVPVIPPSYGYAAPSSQESEQLDEFRAKRSRVQFQEESEFKKPEPKPKSKNTKKTEKEPQESIPPGRSPDGDVSKTDQEYDPFADAEED